MARNENDPPENAQQQQMPMILPGQPPGGQPPVALVEQPAKLIRIASMIRELLEDVRQSKPDEAGRKRLREVYERALTALKEGVSKELQDELETLTLPLENTPSESEVRLAQAQLLGWLEGLFQGIQAALWTQHMQARAEIDEMRRRRGLPHGPEIGTREPGLFLLGRRPPAGGRLVEPPAGGGSYLVTFSASSISASSLGVTFTPWVGSCQRCRTPSVFASGSVRNTTS